MRRHPSAGVEVHEHGFVLVDKSQLLSAIGAAGNLHLRAPDFIPDIFKIMVFFEVCLSGLSRDNQDPRGGYYRIVTTALDANSSGNCTALVSYVAHKN